MAITLTALQSIDTERRYRYFPWREPKRVAAGSSARLFTDLQQQKPEIEVQRQGMTRNFVKNGASAVVVTLHTEFPDER